MTPLLDATSNNNFGVMNLLIRAGADVNMSDKVIHYLVDCMYLSLFFPSFQRGWVPLHVSSCVKCVELLIEAKADINKQHSVLCFLFYFYFACFIEI